MTFKELQLNKTILRAISEKGYDEPTLVQEKTIPLVLANLDLISSAQTGTGKTAAFALPIIQLLLSKQDAKKKKIKALIVSPTRELTLQIKENFQSYIPYTNLRVTAVFGGISMTPQIDILKRGVDILIATPGRLLDLFKQKKLYLDNIQTLVLDEADLMLDMGFINDIKKVVKICPPKKQILLFSATMPQKVIDLANTILNEPVTVEITAQSSPAKTITQLLYYIPKQKKTELCLHLLRNTIKGNVLIFRRTKFGVDKLEKALLKNGYNVVSLHGDKSQYIRQEALDKFKNNEVNILIATDVASRGIDINNLDAVIQFDLPNIPETYVHRIGRTGRANNIGNAYAFCSPDEKLYVKIIQKLINKAIPVEMEHPYITKEKSILDKPKRKGSKHKKGRKSAASKKKKKRWY
ncbi:MAG: DEAD/DEAH box helicase [Flavobacteriaceae bacterium]|nr:DEAD/DEAH box helicase [Flavobacteriaceae bacterium]